MFANSLAARSVGHNLRIEDRVIHSGNQVWVVEIASGYLSVLAKVQTPVNIRSYGTEGLDGTVPESGLLEGPVSWASPWRRSISHRTETS